uniref:SSD domain-containing protein n=1 Tax=Romanomermis culicivorax TaxID=13658 RepID=A0A915K1T2_ROMCU
MDKTYQTLAKFLSPRYSSDSAISLTYPAMSVYGKSSVWAELLRGVTLGKNNVVVEVRVFIAPLQFQYDRKRIGKQILDQCMLKMADYFWNSESRNNLTFYASYEQLFIDELQKTQQYSLPWLSLSVFLVAAFCTLSTVEGCNFLDKKGQHSQISEAGYGLLTIGMSLVAGFGFLFICNYSYNFVVSCTPFVALCVSVDNDFMLLAAWRRTSPHQSVAGRLSEAFT